MEENVDWRGRERSRGRGGERENLIEGGREDGVEKVEEKVEEERVMLQEVGRRIVE